MDFPTISGLPAHPLIVHATVVLVPLAAAAVALHTFWPAARARLGLVTLGAAVLAVVLVPLSTSSGEQLEHDVLGVLAVLVVVGTTQQVVRIGHSGAKASWSHVASTAKR